MNYCFEETVPKWWYLDSFKSIVFKQLVKPVFISFDSHILTMFLFNLNSLLFVYLRPKVLHGYFKMVNKKQQFLIKPLNKCYCQQCPISHVLQEFHKKLLTQRVGKRQNITRVHNRNSKVAINSC